MVELVNIEGVELVVNYSVSKHEKGDVDHPDWPEEIIINSVSFMGCDFSSFVQPYDKDILDNIKRLRE